MRQRSIVVGIGACRIDFVVDRIDHSMQIIQYDEKAHRTTLRQRTRDTSQIDCAVSNQKRMRTMGHVAAKVLANDDMPCRVEASVELLLDLRSDVLLDVVLLERGTRDVDGLLLHLLAHVDVLDDGLGHLLAGGREVADGRGRCRVAFLSHCSFVGVVRRSVWRSEPVVESGYWAK